MARPLRIAFGGGIYHVTSRGDRREPIFVDDHDRGCLLDIWAHAINRFDAATLAYCLMGNHYHFVLQTRHDNLSRLMRQVNGVYAQAFNRRHGLVGHLFQGRFTAIHVDGDAYLMEVCRYTELNPVRARLVETPGDWPWSSYRAHCGRVDSPTWLDTPTLHGFLLARPATTIGDRRAAAGRYEELVLAGIGVDLWKTCLRQEVFLGDDTFVARVQSRAVAQGDTSAEIPRVQRGSPGLLSDWFGDGRDRNEAIYRAYVNGRWTMSEIGREACLSVSRVSRLIKRIEAEGSSST